MDGVRDLLVEVYQDAHNEKEREQASCGYQYGNPVSLHRCHGSRIAILGAAVKWVKDASA